MSIARNTSNSFGLDTIGSYSVSSGTNRLLLAGLFGDASDGTPTLKYNSVTMSLLVGGISGGGDRFIYLFGLLAPTTGSNAFGLTWVSTPGHFWLMCADYTGVLQSGLPDTSNSTTGAGSNSLTLNLSGVTNNSWLFAVGRESAGFGAAAWGAGVTSLQDGGGLHIADSNAAVSSGTNTITTPTWTGSATALAAISFAPDTGGGSSKRPIRSNVLNPEFHPSYREKLRRPTMQEIMYYNKRKVA